MIPKAENKGKRGGGGFSFSLSGRGLALVILVLVSTACFALGFFVGRAAAPEEGIVKKEQVRVEVLADCPEPMLVQMPADCPEPTPPQDLDVVKTKYKPTPPKRMKRPPIPPPTPKVEKAPEPAPKVEKAPEPPVDAMYTVQVGAFENLVDAEKLRKRFQAKGYDSFVMREGDSDGKAVFKVRVGEFENRDSAGLLALKIKSIEGIGAFVIRSR